MNVLIVDDDEALRGLLVRELSRSGGQVAEAASAAQCLARLAAGEEPDVLLLDLMLPDRPGIELLAQLREERPGLEVVVLTAHGSIDTALAAVKLGAQDYLRKPFHLEELELALRRAAERHRLGQENARLREALNQGGLGPELVGSGPAFEELSRLLPRLAASDGTVLIRGETGTGKELVARSLHRMSPRREQPFVVVDCAALHENLLQSELFGHEQGAFTGATRRKHGLFEAADGGTVFLDEIGDVSPAVQAGLLRVLESSTFRHLGGTREVRVDVRLVAATNRGLERLMAEGRFRRDLFFRLNAMHVELPPLRQRREDVPVLAQHFVALHDARHGTDTSISPAAAQLLQRYDWPGNVRELRHVVERALVLAERGSIRPADLPAELRQAAGGGAPEGGPPALTLAEVERQHIAHVLALVGGHRARAAQLLGISERNLYRRIHELDIDPPGGEVR
ncbi:MAG: sigma-54-dependent Fis family transcriptional regulator [Deltaproteobacteria bacterium]|nr:sigma-54-dependent Fis family transcriptional regulator [Deltaproteobacteria bacterium]